MITIISIYTYAILILIIIWAGLTNRNFSKYSGHKLFKALVIFTIVILLTDLSHEYLNGVNTRLNQFFYPILTIVLYIIPFFLGVIWTVYVYLLIHLKLPKLDFRAYFFLIPALIGVILSIFSGFFPIFFEFNNENVYSRGTFYALSIILHYFYFVFPTILVLIHHKKIHSYKFYPLIFFVIPPMIAGIIQAFAYGILIIWPFLALSVLMVFIFVQSQLIKTDYLTGLMNKGAFENHIEKIDFHKKDAKLATIFMDLDNFKNINDRYGHSVGDEVLRVFANKCQETFYKVNYLARIGGDEFVVLLYINQSDEIDNLIKKLIYKLQIINQTRQFEFDISFSYGRNIFDENKFESIRDFLNQSDKLMYKNKNTKR